MDIPLYLVPLAAAAAVAAAGLPAAARLHRDADTTDTPATEKESEVGVAVLGFPKSGKTALLAAMYQTMSRAGGDGVTVRASHPDHTDQLNDLAQRFEELNGVLPFPNTGTQLHPYPLAFDMPGAPLRFTYPDYSGELLRESQRGSGLPEPLAESLDKADIVLGILDGAKLAAMMRDGPDDTALGEIRHLIGILDGRDQVIQLCVTKWDLLDADGHTLEEVITWLRKRTNRFHNLRRTDRDSPVRVIPVSAFGLNSFMATEDGGSRVRRDPGLTWQPFQAAHPISCGINDILTHNINRFQRQPQSIIPASASPFLSRAMKLLGLVTVSTDVAGNVQFSLNMDALARLQTAVSAPLSPSNSSEEARALRLILRHCRDLADDLDRTFPHARPR
ncbi:TRAFAC clade GTPase domain-containing protein [Actinoplanes rectilineatus]|uniref:TRAFAC clade GTPase domain-containing protein n=1 Tax=Actinoplanes rectilineatus TaxID=113571 RepID=UPI0005F2EFE4|nr:hypothetical protein [Actinoplanes rectilineatus]